MNRAWRTWLVIVTAVYLAMPVSALAWTPIVITRVVDGDTIRARIGGESEEIRIRLYGIDAPERRQPYGQQATRAMKSLTNGEQAEMEVMDKDRYGRTVALIRVGGQDINERMVADGYAWVYPRYCRAAFCGGWRSLEKAARAAKRGLWQDDDAMPPWKWRHR